MPETTVSKALAELVKEYSQAEIAKKAGVSPAAVSLLVHGKRGGRRRTIYKIIAAFPEFRRFLLSQNS